MESMVSMFEKRITKLEDEVGELHKNTAASKQEIKMIFNILNEIKDNIKDIASELRNLQSKPAKRWEDSVKIILTVIITSIISSIISGKLF